MAKLPLTISVSQIKGKGRGKKLGIPTFNFKIPNNLKLRHGVYAGWLINEDKKYAAAIHFGPRPQFAETDTSLEAFILDKEIPEITTGATLEFVKFIRKIKLFSSVNHMLKQIEKDVEEIRNFLLQQNN